ncbi:MAG: hypothetical protein P8Y37_13755 [Anaerolineales bacterium]
MTELDAGKARFAERERELASQTLDEIESGAEVFKAIRHHPLPDGVGFLSSPRHYQPRRGRSGSASGQPGIAQEDPSKTNENPLWCDHCDCAHQTISLPRSLHLLS